MGLYVLKAHEDLVRRIAKKEYRASDDVSIHKGLCYMGFDEVNYGELPFLPLLRDEGIAYDSCWSSGSEYDPGEESCRFTEDGDIVVKTGYQHEANPPMQELLNRIKDPEGLVAYITHYAKMKEVLPWLNQEEYGRKYRVMRLLQVRSTPVEFR